MPGPTMEGFGILGEWLYQQDKLVHERLGTPPTAGWMPQDFIGAFGQSLPRYEAKAAVFLETATEAQWKQLCGAGLSLAQCTPKQAAILERLIPNPLRVWNANAKQFIEYSPSQRSQAVVYLTKWSLTSWYETRPYGLTFMSAIGGESFLKRLHERLGSEHPKLSLWWGGSNDWLVRWDGKQPVPLLYPSYEPEPPKGYEAQWVMPPKKLTNKTLASAVLDLRALRAPSVLAGLRAGEF